MHVVFDGSGAVTFRDSLASLRRHGVFAWFGPVLGGASKVNTRSLARSVRIGFPTFADHIPTRSALLDRTRYLFELIGGGDLRLQ